MYRHAAAMPHAPSAMFLRAVIGGVKSSAGLAVAPDIPAAKLAGALSFAPQAQPETPLLLVDTSVMLSGKAGMLVTDRAVYFDAPRQRVPLEAVVHPPVPKSPQGPATLPTALGTVVLPDPLEPSAEAMLRALRAVAWFNRGASRFAFAHVAVPGPVGEIAAGTLRHPDLAVAPMVPAAVHAASNTAAGWLDHDAGEELLAFLDETVAGEGTRGIALTDRRLIAFGDTPREVSYAQLTGVALKTGMLSHTLQLATAAGVATVETIAREPVVRAVAQFLTQLGSLPPTHRQSWPGAPPAAEDPSGAAAAMQSLPMPDLRAATLLELISAAVARGAMSAEVGRDFVNRALRIQRTLRGGHGRTAAMMRAAMCANDFERTLGCLLGRPVWEGFDGAVRVVDFDLGRAGSALGTVASNVVGLGLLAVVGVGWVSLGSSGRVPRLRVRIAEGPGGAGFTCSTPEGVPIARESAKFATGLLGSLADASAPTLLRRVLFGWQAPLDALLAVPAAELDQRVRALVAHADVAPFFGG